MALPITIPYTFANATTSIPLSQLDNNFSTVVTAVNGIGNGTNSLSNATVTATNGNTSRSLATMFSDVANVKNFGAVGSGSVNDQPAIQAAINSLGTSGGTVFFPPGKYRLDAGLTIGNGTSGGTFSTYGAVQLIGAGPGPGVGYANPVGGVGLIVNFAGNAITFQGPLNGWGIENIFITYNSGFSSGTALVLYEASQGHMRGVSISSAPSIAIYTTTYGNNNCNLNLFDNVYIYMSSSNAGAIGVFLDGLKNGAADTSENTFNGLHIQPGAASHVGILLGYCDSNDFYRTIINPYTSVGIGCAAVEFDYTRDFTSSGGQFPNGNQFFHLDPFNNYINSVGTINTGNLPRQAPNRITAFSQQANAVLPSVPGVAVQRLSLSDDTTFYVGPTGSDTYGTGNSDDPFLTIQYALSVIADNYDFCGKTVTIQLNDGTYTSGVSASQIPVNGSLVISGNSSNSAATVVSTSGTAFSFAFGANITLKNMKIISSGGSCIAAAEASTVVVGTGMIFGAAASAHMLASLNGIIIATSNYSIIGGAAYHVYTSQGGSIQASGLTVTLTGTPAFSSAYAQSSFLGNTNLNSNTYSGSATGKKYDVQYNSIINSGVTLPGSTAGTTANGGIYL